MAKLLTLDLGTTTGFAVGSSGHMIMGTWSLKPSRYDGGGMRFVKFRARLDEIYNAYPITHVFYEEVRRHAGTDAAHVYGGLMATLTAWCEERSIPYRGLPVGTIKKHFTGNGNASKQLMIAECERRGFRPKDDNEADAIAVFDLALAELGLRHPDEPPEVAAVTDAKEAAAA
jgi:Holliday junction resolvasome RuvABC endonuclease subunit